MAWEQLHSIAAEAAEGRRRERDRPAACPHDGEPLDEGPGGVLACPWGDYQWPRDGRL